VESLLDSLARREVVVGLALAGAALALIGSIQWTRQLRRLRAPFTYLGYILTGASVALFIVAGFRS
jgi:hypothetical protein